MDLTRRGRATAGCGLALLAAGLLLTTPVLLLAAAAIGGLLLGVAGTFVRRLVAERAALEVSIEVDPQDPLVDETSTVTLSVERPESRLPLRATLASPGPADAREPISVVLDTHEHASRSEEVTWPVAGTYSVERPRVVATDPLGLFVAGFESPAGRTVNVRARQPQTVHLGHGGNRVAATFGAHRPNRSSAGIEPAKLKRYQPGEEFGRIDWKATARLDDVYVVEPKAEADRQTVLLMDHRATTGVGSGRETVLAYLRHAALALVESARHLGDPVGLYAVGDQGVTVAEPPEVSPGQYPAVSNAVRSLTPTRSPDGTDPSAGDGGGSRASTEFDGVQVESDRAFTARCASQLGDREDAFARALHPFFEDATQYLHHVGSDPLFAAARTYLNRVQGSTWTVVLTDDTRRTELKETVKIARRSTDRVLVIVAPRALFDADGLRDLDRTYDQFRNFESFRQDLASMDRVDALELAPDEHVESVLAAGGGVA